MQCKIAIIVLLGILLHTVSPAQKTIQFEHIGFGKLIIRANQEKKKVMFYFTGTGCTLCVKMEKQVFTAPEVANFYNTNFINVESFDDFDKPDSATKRLRRQFGVISNPTFIFIDSEGNIIHKSGYKTTADFLITGKQAASKDDNYFAWTKQFAEGKFNAEPVSKYLSAEQKERLYAEDGYKCKAGEVLDKYFSSISEQEYSLPVNWKIINNYVYNPYSVVFNYLVNNQSLFDRKFGKESINKKIYDTYHAAWSGDMGSSAYKTAEKLVLGSTHPMARQLVRFVEMDIVSGKLSQEKNSNWNDFIAQYDADVISYPYLVNSYLVNDVTKSICSKKLNDKKELTSVNRWMKIILSLNENEDADFFALYAKTFYLLGNTTLAIETQQKAISISVAADEDKKDVEAFKKTLASYQHN